MSIKTNPHHKGLWERKTLASAVVSALIAGAVAASVCAFKGETLALDQSAPVRVSDGRTASFTGTATNSAEGQ